MATQAQRLSEFAERLKYEDIPTEVVASELEYARLITETVR